MQAANFVSFLSHQGMSSQFCLMRLPLNFRTSALEKRARETWEVLSWTLRFPARSCNAQ